MTEKQVLDYVWKWQKLLRLEEWDVLVKSNETDTVTDDGRAAGSARTEFNEGRHYLRIARDHPDKEVKSNIRHELLHLALTEMSNLLGKAIDILSPEAAKLLEDLMYTAEERTVYRLQRALVELEVE